ncbi:hypothetical protein [Dyadobacter helix]|nr:hypothetical protein [Dyadobacter sp. CECT 9275]
MSNYKKEEIRFFLFRKVSREDLAGHQRLFSGMLVQNMVSRMEAIEKERVSPQKAVEVLRREGLEVTESQAKKILEFLEKLANIAVNQCLKDLKDDVL